MGLNKRLISTAAAGGADGTDNFDIVTYTGTGSSHTVTSSMLFQPDLIFVKNRDQSEGGMFNDSLRSFYGLGPDGSLSEFQFSYFTANSNGFDVNASGGRHNQSGIKFVAWCWKGGGAAVTNTNGTINSQVRANTDAGFSIVSYTGNQAVSTIGHGLSSAPEMIIAKSRSVAQNWAVYHKDAGNQYWMQLNGTTAKLDEAIWNDTTPTNSVFSINGNGVINASGSTNIAYCFHSVDGYQKIGSYAGNGTNQTINVGFTPRFVMIKAYTNSSAYTSWAIFDSERLASYDDTNPLWANQSTAEGARGNGSGDGDVLEIIFVTDTGFKLGDASRNNASDELNDPNNNYIYLAIK